MSINIGAQSVVSGLDLAALGANMTSPAGYVVTYLFTGTSKTNSAGNPGDPLPVLIHSTTPATGPSILSGLALEALPAGIVAPHFYLSPSNKTGIVNGSATFSALAAGGTNPPSYQWYFAGAPVAGATNTTLSLTGLTTNNTGIYSVVASNSVGRATNNATLTVDPNASVSMVSVTGPYPGQGLNLNGNIVLAEFYGNTNDSNLVIGNANFVRSTRPGGNSNGVNKPNFGPDAWSTRLAAISYYSVWAKQLNFTIPTTAGVHYRLQLILHDNFYAFAGSRIFNVSAGGSLLVQDLDLAALGANVTNPKDIAVVYTFIGDGNPLPINMAASTDNAILCALTLEDLSSAPSSPAILQPVGNVFGLAGGSAQFFVSASGGGLSYQWQKMVNSTYVNLSNGGNVSGSTSNILTLSNIGPSDSTNYNVLVSNTAGSTNSTGELRVMTPSPNALIGRWITGNQSYADTSGYAFPGTHDGYLVGSTPGNASWVQDTPPSLPAASGGYALSLSSGGNAGISISNSAMADPSYAPTFDTIITNSFTVATWVKGWPAGNYGAFVAKNGEQSAIGTNGFQLRKWANFQYPTFSVRSGTNTAEMVNVNATNASDGDWHHVVGTRNGTTGVRSLYVDSYLVARYTNDFGPMGPATLDHLILGGRGQDGNGPGNWGGGVELFDVRMYGYALNVAEISSIDGITNLPSIFVPPVSQTVMAGSTVQFAVTADGVQLAYQWQKIVGGVTNNLTNGGNISGSTSNVLTLTSVNNGDVASYQVVVSNPVGSTNAVATLTVSAPPNPTPISFTFSGGQLTMNWTNGILQSTTNLATGPWVPEATNPPVTITVPPTGSKFYRTIQ